MQKRVQLFLLMAVISSAMVFTGCGNIDIVKRKYRPGFHVDISKKQKASLPAGRETKVRDAKATAGLREVEKHRSNSETVKPKIPQVEALPDEDLTASIQSEPKVMTGKEKFNKVTEDVLLKPFRDIKREKLGSEMRRAVFGEQPEDKSGWSVLSFISTGLGAVGLALVITGMAFLVSFIFAAGFVYWWIFGLVGLLFGIGAMVTGIISMRQTGSGEKRGRGFALAGMISGIVSLALGLITVFWGLIYWLINRLN